MTMLGAIGSAGGLPPIDSIAEPQPGGTGGGTPVAPGIVATGSAPLPPIASPAMVIPPQVDVALTTAAVAALPLVTGTGGFLLAGLAAGRALIDLDGGYWLRLNEHQSEVLIENRNAAMETRIWGAGQVAVNGHDAGQFFGTTSFELANGAKITIETAQDLAQQAYYLDRLVVTKEERAVIISGVASNSLGDLHLAQSNDGVLIDASVRDGFVLVEQPQSAPPPAPPPAPLPLSLSVPTAAESLAAALADVAPEDAAATAAAPVELPAAPVEQPVAIALPADPAPMAAPLAEALPMAPPPEPPAPQPSPVADVASDIAPDVASAAAPPTATPASEVSSPLPALPDIPAQPEATLEPPTVAPAASAEPVPAVQPVVADVLVPAQPQAAPEAPALLQSVQPVEMPAAAAVPVAAPASAEPLAPPASLPSAAVETPPKIVGGWAAEWGEVLTTGLLQRETGVKGDYGPDSQMMSLGETSLYISQYIIFGHVTTLFALSQPYMSPGLDEVQRVESDNRADMMSALEAWMMAHPGAEVNGAIGR